MKHFQVVRISLLLALMMTFLFSACGTSHKKTQEDEYLLRPATAYPLPSSAVDEASADLRKSARFTQLTKQISFKDGGSQLSADGKKALDQIADELKQKGNSFEKIRVAGFTNESDSDERNIQVSDQRATVVRKYLISKGVPSDKLESMGMGTGLSSYEKGKAPGAPSQKAADRRIEFQIVE